MYGWGNLIEIQKKYPKAESLTSGAAGYGSLSYQYVTLTNFPGDCGALTMQGCNYATLDTIKAIKDIASMTGHSKLFGTIVGKKDEVDRQVERFKKAGFRIIKRAMSNRNNTKHDVVVFFHNKNCKFKGY
jgi:hypothetical protein